MAELTTRERRQPCLLDRLTDDDPQSDQESRDRRVLSAAQMRRGVLRDVSWLLNTGARLEPEDLEEFPFIGDSVLNYGVPDLCGLTGSGLERARLERMVVEAVQRFEPRIMARSLTVRAVTDAEAMGPTALFFEIQGELWAQPMPERLYVKTALDLETGQFAIEESPGG